MTKALMAVPKMANTMIEPMFWKKLPCISKKSLKCKAQLTVKILACDHTATVPEPYLSVSQYDYGYGLLRYGRGHAQARDRS